MPDTITPLPDQRFPCTDCGADMRYVPAQDIMCCPHCGATSKVAQSGPWDQTALSAAAGPRAGLLPAETGLEETNALTCPSCAAEFLGIGPMLAMECPFCASPVAAGGRLHRHIRPHGVLPFGIDSAEAKQALRHWLRRHPFVPLALRRSLHRVDHMCQIYLPAWMFSASLSVDYAGYRRQNHGKYGGVEETFLQGRLTEVISDAPIRGVTAVAPDMFERLTPWPVERLQPYRSEYLSGFQAAAYTLPLPEAETDFRQGVRRDAFQVASRAVQGRITRLDVDISDLRVRLVLLPVWIMTYRHRGQAYQVAVNGQTGTVTGQLPVSGWKTTVLATLIILSPALLIALMLWL